MGSESGGHCWREGVALSDMSEDMGLSSHFVKNCQGPRFFGGQVYPQNLPALQAYLLFDLEGFCHNADG